MNAEAALEIIEKALGEERLSKLQVAIFRQTWNELSYQEIARDSGYEVGYIKQIGSQLWQVLSTAFGEKVRKGNVHVVLKRYANRTEKESGASSQELKRDTVIPRHADTQNLLITQNSKFKIQNSPSHSSTLTDWGEAPDVSTFYGRTEELATLERWVLPDRCRLVGLFGMGGIGKTALSVKLAQQVAGGRWQAAGTRAGLKDTEMRGHGDAEIQNSQSSVLNPQPLVSIQTSNLETQNFLPPPFTHVIWRSLRNAPPIHDLLADLILFLSDQRETVLPDSLDRRILRLLEYLRRFRCLLILDNAETVMQAGDRDGGYQPGYEGYGQLLRCIAETDHQSCLLLTSREKPKGFAPREGDVLPVRSLQVTGLNPLIGRELFDLKGTFSGSVEDWQALIAHYAGNPLALKIVATAIADFFDGSIAQFLEFTRQGNSVFGDIRDLLARQIGRLSQLEQEVMVWLTVNREPVRFAELQTDCLLTVSPAHLLETLTALERRSLIEKSGSLFTLQPAVMEYLTDWLIEQVCEAVGNGQLEVNLRLPALSPQPPVSIQNSKLKVQNALSLLCSHALIKAQAKDYIRETQIRLVLKPIADRLLQAYSRIELDHRLMQILSGVRGKAAQETGYVGGNVINLLCQLQVDLSDRDFSHLTLWQAYFRKVTLHGTSLAHSDLTKSVFTETFSQILNVAFSPDGSLLAASDISYEVHIWRVVDGKKLLTCKASDGWAWSVVFSPDSQLLASSANGTIHLWDVKTGECLQTMRGYTNRVFSLAFSPDGCLLASGNEDHQICLWNVATGELVAVLTEHSDEVHAVAFSPDGRLLASGSYDRTIKLWEVSGVRGKVSGGNWQEPVEDPGTQRHGDTETSAQNSKFNTHSKFRTQSSELPSLLTLTGHAHWVWSVAFSLDGNTLASSSSDRAVKLWDSQTGRCLKTLTGHTEPIRSIAFISPKPNIPYLVSGSDDHTVRIWDYEGNCLRVLQGHTSWISAVAASPDGCLIASGSEDQSVRLWDSRTNHCLRVLQGYNSGVWSAVFSPDGKTLISGGQDRMIRVWNLDFRRQAGKEDTGKPGQGEAEIGVAKAAREVGEAGAAEGKGLFPLSPSPFPLAAAKIQAAIKLQNSLPAAAPLTLSDHTSWIWSVAVSPDGVTIASGSEDGTARLWDVSELGKQKPEADTEISAQNSKFKTNSKFKAQSSKSSARRTLSGHTHAVWSVAFSPDGKLLASGSLDGTVRLWDRFTGQCQQVLQQHQSGVWSVAFAPNGDGSDRQLLASGSQDQTIRLWEITPHAPSEGSQQQPQLVVQPLRTLEGHTSWIRCIVFSSDGQSLASASSDGSVKLWQVSTGECLQTFQAHSSLVLAVAFSPDGKTLATGGGDGLIKLWKVAEVRRQELEEDAETRAHQGEAPQFSVLSPQSSDSTQNAKRKTQNFLLHVTPLNTLQGHHKWVRFLAYSPAGDLLASCSQDGSVKLWDTHSYSPSSKGLYECIETFRVPRPYEGVDITGIHGLTDAQKETLRILGAVD
jgi:WD40 repeat protein